MNETVVIEMRIWMFVLLVGAFTALIAHLVMRGRGFGLIGDIIVGMIGAFVGGFFPYLFGLITVGLAGTLFTAFLGAVLLLMVTRLVRRTGAAV